MIDKIVQKVILGVLALLIVVIFFSCRSSKVDYDKYIGRTSQDSTSCDITLSSSCDWDNLSSSERIGLARYAISEYNENGSLSIFGYTSSGKLAFNDYKTFVNSMPSEEL